MTGRRAIGFMVQSVDGATSVTLPTLIECNNIPSDRAEVLTPEAALHHSHLKPIAHSIPPLDPKAQILLLLGREILRAIRCGSNEMVLTTPSTYSDSTWGGS